LRVGLNALERGGDDGIVHGGKIRREVRRLRR
jgi:hypothetical protein